MDALLVAILSGTVALKSAITWTLAETDDLNSPEHAVFQGAADVWGQRSQHVAPSAFRQYVLGKIRDDAYDVILAAGP